LVKQALCSSTRELGVSGRIKPGKRGLDFVSLLDAELCLSDWKTQGRCPHRFSGRSLLLWHRFTLLALCV